MEHFNAPLRQGDWPGAYKDKWLAYVGGQRRYTDNYLSVSDGQLHMGMYDINGRATITGIAPTVTAPGLVRGARYGMVEWSMRIVPQGSTGLAGWSMAAMAWSDTNNPDHGELDYPESWLGPNDTQGGYIHQTAPRNTFESCPWNGLTRERVPFGTWHEYAIAWTASEVSFWRDGVLVESSTDCGIPTASMHFALELRTSGQPRPNTSWGHIELDWLRFSRL